MHFCSCTVWLGWQLSLVEQFAYREGRNSCWDLYSTLLWWAGPAAGWKLGSWSSGLGCFSFLPDFDSHSVRGPFSLIQVLTPRALTRKVRGEIQGRLAWLLCYSSPKSPHQFPHRHYFFFFFSLFSHHLRTWNTWCSSLLWGGSLELSLLLIFSLIQSCLLSASWRSFTLLDHKESLYLFLNYILSPPYLF